MFLQLPCTSLDDSFFCSDSDLALRNCLLTSEMSVKIGDYGLSQSRYKVRMFFHNVILMECFLLLHQFFNVSIFCHVMLFSRMTIM